MVACICAGIVPSHKLLPALQRELVAPVRPAPLALVWSFSSVCALPYFAPDPTEAIPVCSRCLCGSAASCPGQPQSSRLLTVVLLPFCANARPYSYKQQLQHATVAAPCVVNTRSRVVHFGGQAVASGVPCGGCCPKPD